MKLAELRRHKDSDSEASESGSTGAASGAPTRDRGSPDTILPGDGADTVPAIKQEPPEPGVVAVKQEPLESDTPTAPPAETDTTAVKQEPTSPMILKQEPADPVLAGVKQDRLEQEPVWMQSDLLGVVKQEPAEPWEEECCHSLFRAEDVEGLT